MRKEEAQGHYLMVTPYESGIAGSNKFPIQDLTPRGNATNQTTYVDELVGNAGTAIAGRKVRMTYVINWKTLRFKRSTTVQGRTDAAQLYGNCEERK